MKIYAIRLGVKYWGSHPIMGVGFHTPNLKNFKPRLWNSRRDADQVCANLIHKRGLIPEVVEFALSNPKVKSQSAIIKKALVDMVKRKLK